jgi:hypothetical protein
LISTASGDTKGAVAGASLGFLYYRFIGCHTGAFLLTFTLPGTLIYGGVLGTLVAGIFVGRLTVAAHARRQRCSSRMLPSGSLA